MEIATDPDQPTDLLTETSKFLDQTLSTLNTAEVPQPTSGSESDPSSEDDSSSEDEEYAEIERDAEMILQKELEELKKQTQPRTPHELTTLPEVQPIVIKLTSHDVIEPLGQIKSKMNALVVIQSLIIGDLNDKISLHNGPPALEEGSIVCLENRDVLGEVFEVFGPVRQPYYSIRFNSDEEIPTTLDVGSVVYYPVNHCTKVTASQIYTKGCDASNEHNEEVGEHQQEFSDDEEERRARSSRKRKRKRQPKQQQLNMHSIPTKRQMVQYEEFGHGIQVPNEPERMSQTILTKEPTKVTPEVAPVAEHKEEMPESLQQTKPVLVSTTADELLKQETEGSFSTAANGAPVVGFFEPLQPLEQFEDESNGDVWNKSVILKK